MNFARFYFVLFVLYQYLWDIYVLETFANTHLHTLNTYVKTARLYVFMHLEDFIAYVTVYRHTVMYVSLVWLHNDMVRISLRVYTYVIIGVKDSVQLNNSKNASRNEPIVIGVGETVSFTASSIYSKTTISYMYVSILHTHAYMHIVMMCQD